MPVARESFSVGRRVVKRGDLVDGSDPVIEGREHLFAPVEQATAAPGEKRAVRRPQKPSNDGGTCAGTTAAGEPCGNSAGSDGFCRHHGDG